MDVTDAGLELSPRADGERRTPRSRGGKGAVAALVVVLAAAGFVVYKGLSDASVYFKNADEAVAERASLGTSRFRLQGTVVRGSIDEAANGAGADFAVAFNGVEVQVHHEGETEDLFQPGIPVVLEGAWNADGTRFVSDEMFIKHSQVYQADNGDRLTEAERGGSTSTTVGAGSASDASTPTP